MADIGEILDHKYGPFPLKYWGIGLVGIAGLYYLYKKQAASVASSSSTQQPAVLAANPSLAGVAGGSPAQASTGVSTSDPVIQGLLSDLQAEQSGLLALTGQVASLQTQSAFQPAAPPQVASVLPTPASYPVYSPLPIAPPQPQAQQTSLGQGNFIPISQLPQYNFNPQPQGVLTTPSYIPTYQNGQLPPVYSQIYNQPTPNYPVQNGYVAMGPVYGPTGQPAYYTQGGVNYAPVQQPGQIGFGPP